MKLNKEQMNNIENMLLALHSYEERSDSGLTDNLQSKPRSASTWKEVAEEHPAVR